jgi:dGTP triphosphohydrolase
VNQKWIERRSGWTQHLGDARSPFDVDYARIVHSGSFRRLQGKTQILNLGDSDFYRTRLTHSLEVAQIAGSVVRQLEGTHKDHPAFPYLPTLSLIQAAGFGHDLGHPPFGHGGEVALNYCMHGSGGFEGNGHTLRLLSKLENFSEEHGCVTTAHRMSSPYSARSCGSQGSFQRSRVRRLMRAPPRRLCAAADGCWARDWTSLTLAIALQAEVSWSATHRSGDEMAE